MQQGELSIRPCSDAAYVDGLIARLRPYVTCDGCEELPSVAAVLPREDVVCIEAWSGETRCGVFLILPEDGHHAVHTLLEPPARGSLAIKLGRLGMRWVWENTGWASLHSYAYENRPEVVLFAKLCGFHVDRTISDETTINGKPVRTHLLVIDRPKEEDI